MSQAGPTLLNVTGETRLYVVIGDPIAQVRSTALYNKLSREKGVDAVFVPLQFASERFDEAIAGLRSFKNISAASSRLYRTRRACSAWSMRPRRAHGWWAR